MPVPETDDDGLIRLQKLLAQSGVASRRKCEELMLDGEVEVDGEVVTRLGTKVDPRTAVIRVSGRRLPPVSPHVYLVLNKPRGVVSTMSDPEGRRTLSDVVAGRPERLFHVGRLDTDTSGLLLLTNDGEFKRQLELPASGVERTYRARAFGDISQAQLEELAMGIEIDGVRYGRIDANLERRTGRNQWVEMTLTEGKNREVRKVLEHFGLQVSRLIRTRYGEFTLADLDMGAVDVVPRDELFKFRRRLG